MITYETLIQCFAATGHIAAGFVALARAEGSEVLRSDPDCYSMVRTLLEACRAAGDSEGASRLQAVVERFGLIAEVPVAVAILQGSEWRSEIGVNGGGVGDARKLWTELRRQTAYAPHSLALPWIFVQSRTHKECESASRSRAPGPGPATEIPSPRSMRARCSCTPRKRHLHGCLHAAKTT